MLVACERGPWVFSGSSVACAGDGRLFVHVVAAAFIQARNIAFGCHEFDQLLHASHHAVANKTLAAAPLLATATRLMAKGYRAPGMAFPTK